MPNLLSGTISAASPKTVAVGTTSGEAVPANNNRVGLIMSNLSTGTVYLGLSGLAATLNAGIVLLPSGGTTWSMDDYTYNKDQVNAIAHAAGATVAFQEFIT